MNKLTVIDLKSNVFNRSDLIDESAVLNKLAVTMHKYERPKDNRWFY